MDYDYEYKPKDSKSNFDLKDMPISALTPKPPEDYLRIVGIRLRNGGRIFDFDAGEEPLKVNDPLIVSFPEKGTFLGWVSKPPFRIDNTEAKIKLFKFQRRATEDDIQSYETKVSREKWALERTVQAVQKFKLSMKVLEVEYTLDLKKIIIYFAAKERVDFRSLLHSLVRELHARVELRQVGARDVTKMVGGIGPCGEELCCSRFLNRFHNVNIGMAKTQQLSLKPTRVSGNCGRLKCCLAYEQDSYEEALKPMVGKGNCVKCEGGGCGVVTNTNILKQEITVHFDDGSSRVMKPNQILEVTSMRNDYNLASEEVVDSLDENDMEEVGSLEDGKS
jgi:cell fate regulator YaaT (PSP1 superfamily)